MPEIILNVKIAERLYNELKYWGEAREKISKYFQENPENNSEDAILIKVLLIDGLYGTHLNNIPGGSGALKIAEMIKRLYDEENLLGLILGGNKDAFKVMETKSENLFGRSNLSFVTKYCHFHNKKRFPIYDKYVLIALKDEKIQCHTKKIKPKENLYDVMNELLKKAELKSFEDLDTFLWLYGMKLEYENKNSGTLNNEVKYVFGKNKQLLSTLKIGR